MQTVSHLCPAAPSFYLRDSAAIAALHLRYPIWASPELHPFLVPVWFQTPESFTPSAGLRHSPKNFVCVMVILTSIRWIVKPLCQKHSSFVQTHYTFHNQPWTSVLYSYFPLFQIMINLLHFSLLKLTISETGVIITNGFEQIQFFVRWEHGRQ